METGGHPSQSRYDFDICVALLFPLFLLPIRNRRRQRQKESMPVWFSSGVGNTRQGASRICRSCSVRISLPLGKKRFCLHSAQRKPAHPCRRRTVPSPSFLLVPSGFSPKHRPVESVFSPHWYLSLPLSTPSI